MHALSGSPPESDNNTQCTALVSYANVYAGTILWHSKSYSGALANVCFPDARDARRTEKREKRETNRPTTKRRLRAQIFRVCQYVHHPNADRHTMTKRPPPHHGHTEWQARCDGDASALARCKREGCAAHRVQKSHDSRKRSAGLCVCVRWLGCTQFWLDGLVCGQNGEQRVGIYTRQSARQSEHTAHNLL